MKKKLITFMLLFSALCLCLCAFTIDPHSSVKSLTKPYITTYECTLAMLGDEDILKKYEYIRITFLNDNELEVSYKRPDSKKRIYRSEYTYNQKDGTFEADVGIMGFRFKQSTAIKNGKFSLCVPINGKPLIMNFSA